MLSRKLSKKTPEPQRFVRDGVFFNSNLEGLFAFVIAEGTETLAKPTRTRKKINNRDH
jgi:hypothetical protein